MQESVLIEVKKIGSGVKKDPYHPDIPSGINWSCVSIGETTMTIRISEEDAEKIVGE